MIKVVCGIIYKDNKIFLCRRNSEKQLAGYWEFPGGKIEINEKPEQALIRELYEEISMSVKVLNYFAKVTHKYEKITIELIAYKCEFIEAEFKLTDHDLYEWLDVHQIKNKKLAPADVPILQKLLHSN
ncbi:(deoxy)nucleoside triphosphate pyrophosphohydrolase [Aquimarina sp. D1M17]|uniref:(deoxy)nucleoside triphosphate pyrophosphohydrolase n=1 Tax=Aquimarina acroporae TaxID=2937283 RepID=UPI0020BF250F|nr:(deoxy)nucleoside triphosphate pyrophosphohydrolase [Aquimarina acroporae]MCK8521474.1 (deoxy)nucleoside triphosphate pyrophosphohydrolase [Aquimarina acroporae]